MYFSAKSILRTRSGSSFSRSTGRYIHFFVRVNSVYPFYLSFSTWLAKIPIGYVLSDPFSVSLFTVTYSRKHSLIRELLAVLLTLLAFGRSQQKKFLSGSDSSLVRSAVTSTVVSLTPFHWCCVAHNMRGRPDRGRRSQQL